MSNSHAPLQHLGPAWFAPVMGWSGLGLAWLRAQPAAGDMARNTALACAAMAAAVFLAVLAASVLRVFRHRGALQGDLAHPVRHGFAAALPISMLLLATLGMGLGLPAAQLAPLWWCGLVLQLLVTAWVISRWLAARLPWPGLTPVMYIPIVGNVLVPLGALPLGQPDIGWACLGVGVFFWQVVTAMVVLRQAQLPLPDRLAPSWFILLAPPSVIGLSALAMGAPSWVGMALLGVAALALAAVVSRVPAMWRAGFGMPAWAASFPLAAISALTLRLSESSPGLRTPGVLMLAVTTGVISGLSLATLRGLRNGTLLVAEPAPPAPASAAPASAAPATAATGTG
jgi:tellurite resistance protein